MKQLLSFSLFLFITFSSFEGFGQVADSTRIVEGIIIDSETGEVLIGANVIIKGTIYGTTSDVNGKFQLEIPANDDVILLVSYTCGGFEIKTKKGKSFYKIKTNYIRYPSNKIFFAYGLAKFHQKQNILKPTFEIGFNHYFESQSRLQFGTGIFYRKINPDLQNLNFGALGITFEIKYFKKLFYFETGLQTNYIIHQKQDNSNLNRFYPTLKGMVGYQINYYFEIQGGINYSRLKTQEENLNLLNPQLGIHFTLR